MSIKVLKEFVTGDNFTAMEHIGFTVLAALTLLFWASLLSVETDRQNANLPAELANFAGFSFSSKAVSSPLNEVAPGAGTPRADDSTP